MSSIMEGKAFWDFLDENARRVDETWPEWMLDSQGKRWRKEYEVRRGEEGDIPLQAGLKGSR